MLDCWGTLYSFECASHSRPAFAAKQIRRRDREDIMLDTNTRGRNEHDHGLRFGAGTSMLANQTPALKKVDKEKDGDCKGKSQ